MSMRYELPTMPPLRASDIDDGHDYGLTQISNDDRVTLTRPDGTEDIVAYRDLSLDEKQVIDHARVMAMVTGSIGATSYSGRDIVGRWIRDATVVAPE